MIEHREAAYPFGALPEVRQDGVHVIWRRPKERIIESLLITPLVWETQNRYPPRDDGVDSVRAVHGRADLVLP